MTKIKLEKINSIARAINHRRAQLDKCHYNQQSSYSMFDSKGGSYISLSTKIAESILKEVRRLQELELQELEKEFKDL